MSREIENNPIDPFALVKDGTPAYENLVQARWAETDRDGEWVHMEPPLSHTAQVGMSSAESELWMKFMDTGMLWWVTRILHTFRWVIVYEFEEDMTCSDSTMLRTRRV